MFSNIIKFSSLSVVNKWIRILIDKTSFNI